MSRILDADGTPMRRTPDGDLVPDDLPPSPRRLPSFPPGTPCEEHGRVYGQVAAHCRYCFAEAKAGERPWSHVGRTFPVIT